MPFCEAYTMIDCTEEMKKLRADRDRLAAELAAARGVGLNLRNAALIFGSYAKAAKENNTPEYMEQYWQMFEAFEKAVEAYPAAEIVTPDSKCVNAGCGGNKNGFCMIARRLPATRMMMVPECVARQAIEGVR